MAGNEISFPINVVGTMSPYPVVVIVTLTRKENVGNQFLRRQTTKDTLGCENTYMVYQKADGILSNVLGLLLASTKTCRASSHSPILVRQGKG